MAVIDSDEVFEARMQSSATTPSRAANRSRLTSRRSTMASTTNWHCDMSVSAVADSTRASAACASAAVSLPFSASLSQVWRNDSRAAATASALVSYRRTRRPACAAIWALPRPMAPAPTTPMV